MNLANYVKCLKRHAKNRKISDEKILNAILKPYVIAGDVVNKNGEVFYLDKTRTSQIINRIEDIPGALRDALNVPDIVRFTENKFEVFIDEYIRKDEISIVVDEVAEMIKDETNIEDKDRILSKTPVPIAFLADALIEAIKLKNDGLDPEGELIRNGAYCLKVVYGNIFKYAFKKRSKKQILL